MNWINENLFTKLPAKDEEQNKVDPMFIITKNKYIQDWQPPKTPSTKIGKKTWTLPHPSFFFLKHCTSTPYPSMLSWDPKCGQCSQEYPKTN